MATEFLALAVTSLALGIGSIIALRFRVPPLVIFLLMGLIIGTYGLLQQNTIISFLGSLGSALLLFAIGSEFSIYRLIQSGFLKELKVAIIELGISFGLLTIIFSIWLNLPTALLLALAFSITSTGVALKLLQELGLNRKFDIGLIVKISVIEDLLTVFIFTMISSISASTGQPIQTALVSFVISLVLFVLAYFAFYVFFNKFLFKYNIKEEDVLMLALGVLLLMVSISGALGLSTAFGAYISGSIVSVWKERWKSIENDLRKFSYIFISFFFFTVGLSASLLNVNYILLLLLLPGILIIKFIGVFLGSYATYKSSRTSFYTSLGMLSRGELTLALISSAVTSTLLPASYLGLTALTVFFTIIVSYVLLFKSPDLYILFRTRFPQVKKPKLGIYL